MMSRARQRIEGRPGMLRAVTVVAIAILMAAPHARAQSPDSVMALNRAGQWAEAARLARAALENRGPEVTLATACELAYHLAYATTRLGRTEEATHALRAFDDYACASELEGSWVPAEMVRLRAELGIDPSATTAGPPSESNADGFWRTGDPIEFGLDTAVLGEHLQLCRRTGADACLVVRGGRIVQEWSSPRYREPITAMSTTKSIAGLLAGMLIDDGRLSLDTRVCESVAEWCTGRRGGVTVRHLLSMTSGLPRYEDRSVGFVADKNAFVIALEPEHEPGTRWAYSNEGVQLLEPILTAAAGVPLQDYARDRLFETIGMLDTRMNTDAAGRAWTYADLETTPRDLARIGILMLQRGSWNGEQVVSEDWVRQSTTPSQELNDRYGYLWWLHPEERGYAGHGHLDTHLHVYPELDLVIVRMQARPLPGLREGLYDRELGPIVSRLVSR